MNRAHSIMNLDHLNQAYQQHRTEEEKEEEKEKILLLLWRILDLDYMIYYS
jgi:hypothetical protein